MTNQKITTFLMFTGQADEAMRLYTSVFSESEIGNVLRHEDGTVMHATFTIKGQTFMCIDSKPIHDFSFTPSISLFVNCDSVDEIDQAFRTLSEGGAVLMPLEPSPFSEKFAWINDKYGVSWQLNLAKNG